MAYNETPIIHPTVEPQKHNYVIPTSDDKSCSAAGDKMHASLGRG
jgi:hypothetical protein